MIDDFCQDLKLRGLTNHTIETYRANIKDFLNVCPDVPLERKALGFYLNELRNRGLQGSTLKGYFAALSTFYEYLIYEGRLDVNPIPSFRKRYLSRIKTQHNGDNTRQLISIQEMQLLISSAGSILERALLMCLAKTGMRRGEFLSLKVGDVDLKKGIIRIPAKAKRSNRLSFVDLELSAVLQAYLLWRQKLARTNYLWISTAGGKMHKDTPGAIIARLGAAAGLHDPEGLLCYKLTPHCFRHWFTTHLYRAGMDQQYLKFLRGDSLRSEAWQIYNHLDPEEIRQEYLRRIPKLLVQEVTVRV